MSEKKGFVEHKLIKKGTMQPRKYQQDIVKTCLKKNTLCVLPTGLGKTNIAVLVAAERLVKNPQSRVLVLAPTRPLVNQHYKSFMKFLNLEDVELTVVTGTMKPTERKKVYDDMITRVIFATPQTIRNDLDNDLFSLEKFSLLVIDETHHSVGMYAYPFVATKYIDQAKNKRILGLTASPGSDSAKIKDVMDNTYLETVEIRTEEENDVSPYIMEKKTRYVNVELPERFLKLRSMLLSIYNSKVATLRRMNLVRGSFVSKKQLIEVQKSIMKSINQGDKTSFSALFSVSQAIKIEHAIGLLETQGIGILEQYWKKIRTGEKKADKILQNNKDVRNAMFMTYNLWEDGAKHPKIGSLLTIVSQQLAKNPDSSIIVFANYRDSVKEIVSSLKNVSLAKPVEFVGQREGMTQKEQTQRLKDFSGGTYNVLVCTSIGEEGLDIPSMDLAIFYEPVPSGIRSIQRRGRVGRQTTGEIVFLITKDTRDEAYFWAAKNKEKNMNKALYGMKMSKV